MVKIIYFMYNMLARCGAVGWCTVLQAGRSRVRFQMFVNGNFHWQNPSSRTMALGLTQSLTEMSKVKWSRYRPGVAQRVGRGIALLFHDRGTRSGWVVSSTPRPHFTPGKDPVPILQEAGWVPGPVSTGGNSFVLTGIRSRTVQPVVSRYTDWATRPTQFVEEIMMFDISVNISHET